MKRIHRPTNGSLLVITCTSSDRVPDMREVTAASIIMKPPTGAEVTLSATLGTPTEFSVTATHEFAVTSETVGEAQALGRYAFWVLATLSNGDTARIADDPVYREVVNNWEPIDSD